VSYRAEIPRYEQDDRVYVYLSIAKGVIGRMDSGNLRQVGSMTK
jgi:hypothetical protein